MSDDPSKTQEIPGTASSLKAIAPPKRFLGSALYSSSRRLFLGSSAAPRVIPLSISGATAPAPLIIAQPAPPPVLKSSPSPQGLSSPPPRLIRIPQIVLTPVDPDKYKTEEVSSEISSSGCSEVEVKAVLPPPPPLVRMPIFTRTEKRSVVAAKESKRSADNASDKVVKEPPRKRTRLGTSESSTSTTTTVVAAPPTPRKIIQDIFGPDKSKKSKGKGRKRKRGGTPKKKGQQHEEEEIGEDAETTEQAIENEIVLEQKEEEVDDGEIEDATDQADKDDLQTANEDVTVSCLEEAKSEVMEDEDDANKEEDHDKVKEEVQSDEDDIQPSTRRVNRRKAKQVANEKLKRLSLHNEEKDNIDEGSTSMKGEPSGEKEQSAASGIRSRRSTTEGSSKSGSSTNQDDSDSVVGGGKSYVNRNLTVDRQRSNATPLSLISEDGDQDDVKVEGVDAVSVSDLQEHRDSDVDSTYSWKPVRAAAAIALEQVTKKQGSVSGSTGLPGDAETKAAAAAERRARKIMRYKGRNRRTLLFKSSSSKKLIAARKKHYSAQPTIIPKVLHEDGYYLQPGDIIHVEQENGTSLYGQIKGILMDAFGDVSCGVRWLIPKHQLCEMIDFLPTNYAIRYDIPERLIKLDYVNFVMHLNLDYFDGHPSYNKMEKFSIYSRLGKSINSYMNDSESDDESALNDGQTSSSPSEVGGKSKEKGGDDENSTDASTDSSDIEELDEVEDNSKTRTTQDKSESLEVEEGEEKVGETNVDCKETNTIESEIDKKTREELEEEVVEIAETIVDHENNDPNPETEHEENDDIMNTNTVVEDENENN